MKTKKQISIIILLAISILYFNNVSALNQIIDINIKNNTIIVTGYYDLSDIGLSMPVSIPSFSSINETLNTTCFNRSTSEIVTGTNITIFKNETICTVDYSKKIPININQSSGGSMVITQQDVQNKLEKCISEREGYSGGLSICANKLNDYGDIGENYTRCSSNLQVCSTEKNTAISDKTRIQDELDAGKNQKYIWAAVALIAGILGWRFYQGEIGGPKNKKPEELFNRQQSG